MPTNLPRLNPSADPADRVEVQDTEFTTDVLGRYICNTWDEAMNNGGVAFDVVVIGAGMFGAYCAEKIYRTSNLRVLVLDAGSLLVTEHVQNLARVGLNAAGAIQVESNAQDPGRPRERVWGSPWRSPVPFPGLAYCLGGRSLFWGGWAPQLTEADLAHWPSVVAHDLRTGFMTVAIETGVEEMPRTTAPVPGAAPEETDFISGELYRELFAKFDAARTTVASVEAIEKAPLAVQAAAPASGLFSFDKWSSAPILVDAIREAAANPDWQRRLFYVPRAQVTRLQTTGDRVTGLEVRVNGELRVLTLSSSAQVVLANGTIEATRLALESFSTPLMGRNLVAHLRTNLIVRIKRAAFSAGLPSSLQAAALLVRGSNGSARYHLQVTAAAVAGANSESTMWRAIPDLDLLDHLLNGQTADAIVLTLRGIGEMVGQRDASLPKATGSTPSFVDLSDQTDQFGLRRAWVNLVPTPNDIALWNTMDTAALALARKLANDNPALIEYFHGGAWHSTPPPLGAGRDGLGTTHHEAGTLWLGQNPADSVTNLDARFHHIRNAYVAGPAIFPRMGSANPSLTGLALAQRVARAIVRESFGPEVDFAPLGTGGLAQTRMAGHGGFIELGGGILESVGGPGILRFTTREQLDDFTLRGEFRFSSASDNSGIFIRIPELGHNDPVNDTNPAIAQGYEIQLDNTGFNSDTGAFDDPLRRTGAIYGLAPSTGPMPAVGQWHTFEIEALGPRIIVRIDGQQTSRLEQGTRRTKGYIGLQNHHVGSTVQFRRLRIKRLATAPVAAPARADTGVAAAPAMARPRERERAGGTRGERR